MRRRADTHALVMMRASIGRPQRGRAGRGEDVHGPVMIASAVLARIIHEYPGGG